MQWPRKICVSSFDVTFNHASLGAAPCQCLVKDRSNRKLWKTWYTSHHCTHSLMFDCVLCAQGSLVLLRALSYNQEFDILWPLQDVWFVMHPSCADAFDWATRILTLSVWQVHLEWCYCYIKWLYIRLFDWGLFMTAFNLDFYTDVQDLSYLQDYLNKDPRAAKYRYFNIFKGIGMSSYLLILVIYHLAWKPIYKLIILWMWMGMWVIHGWYFKSYEDSTVVIHQNSFHKFLKVPFMSTGRWPWTYARLWRTMVLSILQLWIFRCIIHIPWLLSGQQHP